MLVAPHLFARGKTRPFLLRRTRRGSRRTVAAVVVTGVVALLGAPPTLADTVAPPLIQIIPTHVWTPPSPDPMGIAFRASTGTLLIADSEVEETPLYAGKNVYESSLTGALVGTGNTTGFSLEPTDVTVKPSNGHVFFSDDNADKVFEVTLGADELLGTSDDTITSFSTRDFASGVDPEGLAYGAGSLFVSDGAGMEIWRVQPGLNGIFDGVPPGGDDLLSHFDTAVLNQTDPEGVEYNPDNNTLLIVSRDKKIAAEVTLDGTLVRSYDMSLSDIRKPSGIAYGPTSNNTATKSIYVTDRKVDNNSDPTENDGRIFEFRVTDPPPNQAPVVTNPGPQSSDEGAVISLQIVATDGDADPLTYNASGLPLGLVIDTTTGLISGTVTSSAAAGSPYTVSVSASDGALTDTEAFTWTVADLTTPVVTNPGPQSSDEGAVISLQIVATDDDADPLTYNATGLPLGLAIDTTTGLISGTIQGGAYAGSPYSATVSADDGSSSASATFDWSINPNQAPAVTNPGAQSSDEGAVISLQIVATDDDADPLTYNATGLPPDLTIDTTTGLISGTVTSSAAAGSPYTVSVSASDGALSDTQSFTWTVADLTTPAVTNPGAQLSDEGAAVSLQIIATDDDADPLTYSATGLPLGLTIDTTTGLISGTIQGGAAAGSPYSATVSADDGSSSGSATFDWTVVDRPPGAPTDLTIEATTTGLVLDWVDSAEADLAGYDIYRSDDGGAIFAKLNSSPVSTSAYADSGAPVDATAFYRVIAVDLNGNESAPATADGYRGKISFVSSSQSAGAGTALTIANPGGAQPGDVLVAGIVFGGGATPTPPSDWTLLQDNVTSTGKLRQALFVHVVTSSEPNSYTFTFAPKRASAGTIVAYRGADAPPFVTAGQANGASTSITAPSLEGTAGAVEIGFFGTRAATSIAPPPGMVEHAEISKSAGAPKVTIECADDVVAVGAIGTRVATASASTQNIGQVVLLVPAP